MGTKMTTDFCSWLRNIHLTGSTYLSCCKELIYSLKDLIDDLSNEELPYKNRAYMNQFIDGHKVWFKTMEKIGVK